MKNLYKKISSWLFRDSLELNKKWWHRLIKVIFLSLFFLILIGSYVAIVTNPTEMNLLSKHNISVKNTLYKFTENYTGEDYKNTIPDFFKQKGDFGVLIDRKIEYIFESSLGNSFCVKTPEKYQEAIVRVYFEDYKNKLGYGKIPQSFEYFNNLAKDNIFEDPKRKCFLYDISTYRDELKKVENLSSNIINYKPNIIFYIESIVILILISLLSFIFFALIYYHAILYIVYGNKK